MTQIIPMRLNHKILPLMSIKKEKLYYNWAGLLHREIQKPRPTGTYFAITRESHPENGAKKKEKQPRDGESGF